MKGSKKISILFCSASSLIFILSQAVFNYFQNKSMISNLGYSNTDISSRLVQIAVKSILFSIFIGIVLAVVFMIVAKRSPKKPTAEIVQNENEIDINNQEINSNSSMKDKDKVLQICRSLNDNSEEIGASMSELSNFTDSQAAYVEQFSAALEEISSGVQQTSENTQHAANFVSTIQGTISILAESIEEVASAAQALTDESQSAKTAVKDGEKIITDAIDEMNNVSTRIKDLADSITILGESTDKIGKIIDVINSITNQTNMLALNASIEAARAGEYGRGFAVVARSIKELSDKSKNATNSISEIIRNIQLDIEEAVNKSNKGLAELETGMSLVKASGDSISNILHVVDRAYEYSSSVTESTKLQDESSKEIIQSINDLSNIVQEVSATTMQESASIQQVASGVEIIKECIDELAAGTQELVTFASAISEESKKLIETFEV